MSIGKWLTRLAVVAAAAVGASGAQAIPLNSTQSLTVGNLLFTLQSCTSVGSGSGGCATGTMTANGSNGITIGGTGGLQSVSGSSGNINYDTTVTYTVTALGSASIYAITDSMISAVTGGPVFDLSNAGGNINAASGSPNITNFTYNAGVIGTVVFASQRAIQVVVDIATHASLFGAATVTTTSFSQTVTVPEPASGVLLVSAFGLLVRLRRRISASV